MSNIPGIGKKLRGGATVPHHKNTAESETVVMSVPETVTLLMNQSIGKECDVVVSVGDKVDIGQIVGNSTAFVSAPIYASISGVVEEIKDVSTVNGSKTKAVVIKKGEEQKVYSGIKKPDISNYESFLQAVKDSGLVGLGGAAFPTHIKLKSANLDKIDTLIINAAECEPRITSDYREMMENTDRVIEGIKLVSSMLNISQTYIGVELNKPKAITLFQDILKDDSDFKVVPLRAKYPQGAEKVIVYECTGRTVPQGKLPGDVGCIVINVTTVSMIAEYARTGMPLVNKRVTVDGASISNPMNILAPIGTKVKDIIEFAGGLKTNPEKLILGGPMMGATVSDIDIPIVKGTNAVLALEAFEVYEGKQTACMRCGKCIFACPLSLMPASFERAALSGNVNMLKELKVNFCMECGTCSYVCPAKRDLVDSIRKGKSMLLKKPETK